MKNEEKVVSRFDWNGTTVEYRKDRESEGVGLLIYPTALKNQVVERRTHLDEAEILQMPEPWKTSKAYSIDSLVQVQLTCDERPAGYAQGRTLRNGQTTESLCYISQEVHKIEKGESVVTLLKTSHGIEVRHILEYRLGWRGILSWTEFFNPTPKSYDLELASSFSMTGITPFEGRDAQDRIRFHRIRSAWSLEGRLVSETLEQLHLERSWQAHSVVCERYGQVGTQPCRGYYPLGAIRWERGFASIVQA